MAMLDGARVIGVRTSKTIYRSGDKTVKVFSEDYSKADVLNEALNLARVENTGLNIPKLAEVCKIDGKWAIVSDFIEGKTLERLMDENPDKEEEYLNLFVELQLDVQKHSCDHLNRLKDKWQRKIGGTDIDATTRYELYMRLDTMPKHYKVCHCDFNPSNIIIDSVGTPYIIDWAHVAQGNASADAAKTYIMFILGGKDELAEKYLDSFCEMSGTPKHYVQRWIPIAAAERLADERPGEHDKLIKWINVVDYE